MKSPPPSLRLFSMAARVPGSLGAGGLLAEDGQLWVEFETYAEEVERVRGEQERRARRGSHG